MSLRQKTASDIYAHFIKSSDKSAAIVIDKIFNDSSFGEPHINQETETSETLSRTVIDVRGFEEIVPSAINERQEALSSEDGNELLLSNFTSAKTALPEKSIVPIESPILRLKEKDVIVCDSNEQKKEAQRYLEDFKRVKAEMKSLCFDTIAEYDEYLEYVEKQNRKYAQKR